MGTAAGVMIAASFWSLLAPAVEFSEGLGRWRFVPPLVGFLAGAAAIRVLDACLPHLHPGLAHDRDSAEGPRTTWRRSTLLVLAITLHNVPEGLAVGVAFGAAGTGGSLGPALALALGIGLQNLPEGLAIALPLRMQGASRTRAFWYGQLSAVVEPIAAIAGAWLVLAARPVLPYAMAFAAGAMIFVAVEELVPESQRHGHVDEATLGLVLGFAIMMSLDVALR